MIAPHQISCSPDFDYDVTASESNILGALLLLPTDARSALTKNLTKAQILRLLNGIVSIVRSVEFNNRSFIEQYLVIECDMTDREAAKINLPTVAGALSGVRIAIEPTSKMCGGCAFRRGTMANQSIITTFDARWSTDGNEKFMCHELSDDENEPTRVCAGYAAVRKAFIQEVELSKGNV